MENLDSTSGSIAPSSGYPEGPITCCLQGISRETCSVRSRVWTVSLLVCFVTVILSTLTYLVAFGTTGWVSVSRLDGREDLVGLWQECIEDECSYITADITGAGFKASQAIAVLCLALIVTCCILTFKYCFSIPVNTKRVASLTLGLRFTSFFFLLLLIPVFATTWDKGHARYSQPIYDGHMSYSFILVAVTFVLEAIGAFFTYCEVAVIQRRPSKALLRPVVVNSTGIINDGFIDITDTGVFPGDFNLTPKTHNEEHLDSEIVSRMNAQDTYETLIHAEMQLDGRGVAGPLYSSGLMPKSAEGISRQFVGITRAEPEYISPYAIGNSVSTRSRTSERSPDESFEEDTIEGLPVMRPMKHSVSMQNMFNENLLVMRQTTDGRLVTSVSMYNVSDNQPEIIYHKDAPFSGHDDCGSVRSWHPEVQYFEKGNTNYPEADPETGTEQGSESFAVERRNNIEETRAPKSRQKRAPVERKVNKQTDNVTKCLQTSNKGRKETEENRIHSGYKKRKTKQHPPQQDLSRKQNVPNKHRETSDGESVKYNNLLESRERVPSESITSLHSVISTTSTHIIGGCAETEI